MEGESNDSAAENILCLLSRRVFGYACFWLSLKYTVDMFRANGKKR